MHSTRLNTNGNENVMGDGRQTKDNNAVAVQGKISSLPELKRPALGEVGNIVRNIETRASKQQSSNPPQKLSIGMFKDVKSKVDSHWRKNEIPTANARRYNGAGPMLVTTKEGQLAKPEMAKTVTFKIDGQSNKRSAVPIRRQESIVSGRPVLRKTVSQHGNKVSSKSESLCVVNNIGMIALPSDVDDIDSDDDSTNLYLASDYVKDIYAYLFQLERKFAIRENYLDGQEQVTKKMRTVLIDWINETHLQFGLLIDTYFMTVAIIDRYLQAVTTTKRNTLQLVGVAAMFIASKYEEMYPPTLKDFVYITDNTYSSEQVIAMEQFIFKNLGFNLSPPLVSHFTRRFSKASIRMDSNYDHTLSKYFTELASLEYTLVHHLPSAIAAASVFMSMKLTLAPNKSNDEIWTRTLQHYTTHTLDDLRPIICTIAKIALHAPKAKETSVYQKYCLDKYEKVALRSEIYGPVMEGLLSF